jgi:large subunit ribosomal protein L29
MKNSEIRRMSPEDLEKKAEELRSELVKLYAQVAMGTQVKSPGQISQIKKNIARIKTQMKTNRGIEKA